MGRILAPECCVRAMVRLYIRDAKTKQYIPLGWYCKRCRQMRLDCQPSGETKESVQETLEIMGEPETMAALRGGIKDVQEGKVIPLEEVKARLGIE